MSEHSESNWRVDTPVRAAGAEGMRQEGRTKDGPQSFGECLGDKAIMEAGFGQHGAGDIVSTEMGKEEC